MRGKLIDCDTDYLLQGTHITIGADHVLELSIIEYGLSLCPEACNDFRVGRPLPQALNQVAQLSRRIRELDLA